MARGPARLQGVVAGRMHDARGPPPHLGLGECPVRVHAWWLVGVAHDEDVVPPPEGVLEHGAGDEEDLRVVARSLARGRAIVVPLGQLLGEAGGGGREGGRKLQGVGPRVRGNVF